MKLILPITIVLMLSWIGPAAADDPCHCQGYAGPGGPCYASPGGPAYDGPGGTGEDCPNICRKEK